MKHVPDAVTPSPLGPTIDRRLLLQATTVAAAAGLVAACGSTDQSAPASQGSAGTALVAVADVPVGGGVVIAEPPVVVTQPSEGDLKAFTAICTHQGCLVSEVVDQEIVCRCHGSTFSIVDGAVIQGPADVGLTPEAISIRDGSVTLA
jgi:Rieske Fe-S protein